MESSSQYREVFFRRSWRIARDADINLPLEVKNRVPRRGRRRPPAQVGFIGSSYKGIVFCLLNPGIAPGGFEEAGVEEDRYFDLLSELAKEEDEATARGTFESLMNQTRICMTGTGEDGRGPWGPYSRFVGKVLDATNLSLEDVAYLNACNYPGVPSSSIYKAVNSSTRELLFEMEPRAVIFRYKAAREIWPETDPAPFTYVVGGKFLSGESLNESIATVKRALNMS